MILNHNPNTIKIKRQIIQFKRNEWHTLFFLVFLRPLRVFCEQNWQSIPMAVSPRGFVSTKTQTVVEKKIIEFHE